MKCLLLSPYAEQLIPILQKHGDTWLVSQDKITSEFLDSNEIEICISYGYRHILKKDILDKCIFINMHISYLPWNRGADPNLWSWIDDTPKGVTIHYIDEGIDTGDIIAQEMIFMGDYETLASSYKKLQKNIILLFDNIWPDVKKDRVNRIKQYTGNGSIHYLSDRERVSHLLINGYDTRVNKLSEEKRHE